MTRAQRKLYSSTIISKFDDFKRRENAIENQKKDLIDDMNDEDQDDYVSRQLCLNISKIYLNSINEILLLGKYSIDSTTNAYKMLESDNIDISPYLVPNDGNNDYDYKVEDIKEVYAPFIKWVSGADRNSYNYIDNADLLYNSEYKANTDDYDLLTLDFSSVVKSDTTNTNNLLTFSEYLSAATTKDDTFKTNLYSARDCIKSILDLYNSQNEDYKISSLIPDYNYKFYYKRIKNFFDEGYNNILVTDVNEVFTELIVYINARINYLISYLSDSGNTSQYNNILNSRLNKQYGSLYLWYSSASALDNTYIRLISDKEGCSNMLSKMITVSLVEEPDNTTVITCEKPSEYYTEILGDTINPNFYVGDSVYLIDDTHSQLETTIMSIESTEYYDYSSITSDSDASDILTMTKEGLKITLKNSVSSIYTLSGNVRLIKDI